MTIKELKKIQADNNLCDFHLVHSDDKGFTIAHTDAERATGQPLEECHVHQYMLALPHNPFPTHYIAILDNQWATYGPRVDLKVNL